MNSSAYINKEGETVQQKAGTGYFFSEGGFSTAGMVLALLITLSLIFTAAQVYQVNSASATIQVVADAGALAAESIVAEFYILARLCDAIVLSLSLASIIVIGLGLVALCVPATAVLSESLTKAGNDILRARNNFAEKATTGLNKVQKILPFVSAVNAASVIQANSGGTMDASYRGIAILMPFEAEEISIGELDKAEKFSEEVDKSKEQIKDAAEKAEEAAEKAKKLKELAFQYDCGNNPSYCMYERAARLSNISTNENPLYRSVETWNFSVALKRAQAYYPYRLANETPIHDSAEGQAESFLRARFYAYAIEELSTAYVHEEETGSFEAYFPLLPKNTSEMKETPLYTEQIYPITQKESGNFVMHAWSECPGASSWASIGLGSIAQINEGGFIVCEQCRFSTSSLGKVAAASTSIENGFEHHYRVVAEAARDYQQAREEYVPYSDEVKSLVGGLFDQAKEALKQAASYRIRVSPPGRYGAVTLVVNTQLSPASQNFSSSFVPDDFILGSQAAISAATLVSDDAEEGATVLNSLLDGVSTEMEGVGFPLIQVALDVWSSLLSTYTQGQRALEDGLVKALDSVPYTSESGLGIWAARSLSELIEALGLEPAELDAPKPVIVNSAHILTSDNSSFSQGLLQIKQRYLSLESSGSGSPFDTLVSEVEVLALDSIEGFGAEVIISSLELVGEGGPSVPIMIALPPAVSSAAKDMVSQIAEALRGLETNMTGIRRWE